TQADVWLKSWQLVELDIPVHVAGCRQVDRVEITWVLSSTAATLYLERRIDHLCVVGERRSNSVDGLAKVSRELQCHWAIETLSSVRATECRHVVGSEGLAK